MKQFMNTLAVLFCCAFAGSTAYAQSTGTQQNVVEKETSIQTEEVNSAGTSMKNEFSTETSSEAKEKFVKKKPAVAPKENAEMEEKTTTPKKK